MYRKFCKTVIKFNSQATFLFILPLSYVCMCVMLVFLSDQFSCLLINWCFIKIIFHSYENQLNYYFVLINKISSNINDFNGGKNTHCVLKPPYLYYCYVLQGNVCIKCHSRNNIIQKKIFYSHSLILLSTFNSFDNFNTFFLQFTQNENVIAIKYKLFTFNMQKMSSQ